jgi:hypothetical protein
MRVSEVFTRGGGDGGYNGYNGGFERYLPYGGVYKPCGYYPDTGRWTYRYPNDYRWEPCGCGYGFSHSFGLRGIVG